jgi:hypothetical protein
VRTGYESAGLTSGSGVSIARVEFLNNVIGVLVLDNSTISISNSLFNVTSRQPSTGVSTVNFANVGAQIIISHCVFTGLTNGVEAVLGHFTVEDSLFNNTDVGFEAADISSMLTDGRSPYVITGCQFSSNAQVAILIRSPNGLYVIADNVCTSNGQPDIAAVPCEQTCIIENNSGCTLNTAKASHAVERIVLSDQ